MKLKVDEKADALYLRLDESKIVDSQEASPGVVLDFNDKNQVVGVEILNLSKRATQIESARVAVSILALCQSFFVSSSGPTRANSAERFIVSSAERFIVSSAERFIVSSAERQAAWLTVRRCLNQQWTPSSEIS